jgi:hypothetical protein
MNTNIMMVAVPFTTAERVLDVTRNAGFKYPAYSDANTPVVQSAIAATLRAITHGETPLTMRICVMFAATGRLATSFELRDAPFEEDMEQQSGNLLDNTKEC